MLSFTQEDLLQYMYSETSPKKTAAIKAALDTNWSLHEKYKELTSALQGLEKLTLSPRKKVVDDILHYAEKSVSELTTEV